MGGALARAVAKSGVSVLLADPHSEKLQALAAETGARAVVGEELVATADFIFLGVKPQIMADALAPLVPALKARERQPILVSMAAGLPISRIRELAGGFTGSVIRIMPNTPASLGAGMIVYTPEEVPEEALAIWLQAMAHAGRLERIPESLMNTACAVSGCAPAWICQFAEGLAKGGAAAGMPIEQSRILVAQTLLGTARLLLETGRSPEELKKAVCSPGGATLKGVEELERRGLEEAVGAAVSAAIRRSEELARG